MRIRVKSHAHNSDETRTQQRNVARIQHKGAAALASLAHIITQLFCLKTSSPLPFVSIDSFSRVIETYFCRSA